jgi:hypothetical protein
MPLTLQSRLLRASQVRISLGPFMTGPRIRGSRRLGSKPTVSVAGSAHDKMLGGPGNYWWRIDNDLRRPGAGAGRRKQYLPQILAYRFGMPTVRRSICPVKKVRSSRRSPWRGFRTAFGIEIPLCGRGVSELSHQSGAARA